MVEEDDLKKNKKFLGVLAGIFQSKKSSPTKPKNENDHSELYKSLMGL